MARFGNRMKRVKPARAIAGDPGCWYRKCLVRKEELDGAITFYPQLFYNFMGGQNLISG